MINAVEKNDNQSVTVTLTDDDTINPIVTSSTNSTESRETQALTHDDLQPVLDGAINRLSTVVDPSVFNDIQISITNLDGQLLGTESNGNIVIDLSAAGFGWFIDATPGNDSEFRYDSSTNQYQAITEDASGKIDLLSVLMHELGHVAGLDHDDSSENFMNSELEAGTRSTGLDGLDSFFSNDT